MNRTVKKVEKAAPLVKYRGLVLLLGKLVVDVLKLNGFGVVVIVYPTDTVRKHPLKWYRLLGCLWDCSVLFCPLIRCLNLFALLSGKVRRQFDFTGLWFSYVGVSDLLDDGQSLQPPL